MRLRIIQYVFLCVAIFSSSGAYAVRCAVMSNSVTARSRESKQEVTFERGAIVEIRGQTKSKAKYALVSGTETALVPAEALKVLPSDKSCASATVPPTPPSTGGFWKDWRFGIQAGMLGAASGEDFDDLKTEIPDASDVGGLSDPIIVDINDGKGYWLKASAEKTGPRSLWFGAGFTYRTVTYSYTAKANPTLGSVTLDQLASNDHEFDRQQLRLNGVAGFRHPFGMNWSFGYGVELALLYNLGGEEKIDLLVASGPFLKNTSATVTAKPPVIDYEVLGVADVRWHDLSLALGYGIDGMWTLGLGYLF